MNLEGGVRIKVTEKWGRVVLGFFFFFRKITRMQELKQMEGVAYWRPEAPSIAGPVRKVSVVWGVL